MTGGQRAIAFRLSTTAMSYDVLAHFQHNVLITSNLDLHPPSIGGNLWFH